MKRVLVAATLGGLLIVGVPTLASSAQRSDSNAGKSAAAADKGGDKGSADKGGDKGADHKGGDKGNDNRRGDRGDRADHRGDRRDHDGHGRYGHGYRGRYGYGGGYYYGEPQDCYYGPSGAYNCEPYGGDYGYGGYRDPYGYNYRGDSRDRNVVVSQRRFNPPEIRAFPGQEILWTFQDGNTPHTVTADNNSFDSGRVTEGEFRLAFSQPGTYSYHCSVHREMHGRVIISG
jgi:plastocyanin